MHIIVTPYNNAIIETSSIQDVLITRETDTEIIAQGVPGVRGASAYEVAVKNGFSGTEKEWLDSLKGEPGVRGLSAYEIAYLNGDFKGTEKEFSELVSSGGITNIICETDPNKHTGDCFAIIKSGYDGTRYIIINTVNSEQDLALGDHNRIESYPSSGAVQQYIKSEIGQLFGYVNSLQTLGKSYTTNEKASIANNIGGNGNNMLATRGEYGEIKADCLQDDSGMLLAFSTSSDEVKAEADEVLMTESEADSRYATVRYVDVTIAQAITNTLNTEV